MKISIITPTYRRHNLIKKNYNIIRKNFFNNNLEWIILSEYGDNLTNNLIKTFNSRFVKHFIGYYKDNDKAFNIGVKHATGDLLVIYGDDDFFYDDTLKILKNKYKPNIKWIIGYGDYINSNFVKSRKFLTFIKVFLTKNFSKTLLLSLDYIMTPSIFFSRKEFIKLNGLTKKLRYGSDYILWIKFSKKFKPFLINKFLSKVRYDNTTKTGTFDIKRYIIMLEAMRKETNSILVKMIQSISIILIILINFIVKKVLR